MHWNHFFLICIKGNGLKLEKIGQFFQVWTRCIPKIAKNFVWVVSLLELIWSFSFWLLLVSVSIKFQFPKTAAAVRWETVQFSFSSVQFYLFNQDISLYILGSFFLKMSICKLRRTVCLILIKSWLGLVRLLAGTNQGKTHRGGRCLCWKRGERYLHKTLTSQDFSLAALPSRFRKFPTDFPNRFPTDFLLIFSLKSTRTCLK